MDGIISHRFKLKRIEEAFATLEDKPKDYIKGVVVP
jgi:threonine dehydrogenase-like Zn-dependent dehydrogenase